MKPQATRTRLHMVSREVGWCATLCMRCERLITTETSQYCRDSGIGLCRLNNCVFLDPSCQAEHNKNCAAKYPRPELIQREGKKPTTARKLSSTGRQNRLKSLTIGKRKQANVTCESLGLVSHCKSRYERCEYLLGRGTFRCEWLGCDLARTSYGPLRPQECLEEPADDRGEK
jgi:hypothetical protein